MTPLDLYLSCHNLSSSSFDQTMKKNDKRDKDKKKKDGDSRDSRDNDSGSGSGSNSRLRILLNDALEYNGKSDTTTTTTNNNNNDNNLAVDWDWDVIENILAFQSSLPEQGVKDEQSGLYPFMKAAIYPQCTLNVVYNLALYNVELLNNGE